MVKSELIQIIEKKYQQLSKQDVEMSVNTIIESMSSSLSRNERIEIRGFGSFSLHYRPPRIAHNPKTGDRLHTEAKYTPHFKPGKALKERVNESRQHHEIKTLARDDDDDNDSLF